MEELFNLTYKEEVEALKEEDDFEKLGDAKFLNHSDKEARLYWAFCRPSGSCEEQLRDRNPLVSIMAFNHSRLPALKRFQLLHPQVLKDEKLRIKIAKRSRMLFRDLVDNDFSELNLVLELVPQFLDTAIDQLKNGRKWNDIACDAIQATKFMQKIDHIDDAFLQALEEKLQSFDEFDAKELKEFLLKIEQEKDMIDQFILKHYNKKANEWIENSNLHLLQQKSLKKISDALLE